MLKKILKDERGLSLVELLAVVVIMAIIAGIGAVAISGVIQKNKEDAGISAVQNLMSAAVLYQTSNQQDGGMQNTLASSTITGKVLKENNYISTVGGITDAGLETIKFWIDTNGKVHMNLPDKVVKGGSKESKAQDDLNEDEVASLKRSEFYHQ